MVFVADRFNSHYLALQENWIVCRELFLTVDPVTLVLNESPSRLMWQAVVLAAIRGSRINKHCSNLQPSTQPSFFFVVFSDLDLSLSLTGRVVKTVGDALSVKVEKNASGDHKLSWTKVMGAGLGCWSENGFWTI